MTKYNVTRIIEEAINKCVDCGSGYADFGNGNTIETEWIEWSETEDIVVIYFKDEKGFITHSEVIMETLTLNNE